jgi:hypothetical protein
MPNRRPRTALMLVGMGVVLLAAIAIGQQIGERTIFGADATQRRIDVPAMSITPVPDDTAAPDEAISRNWKRLQVVSVATDPAFPDPRVTPTPARTPKPTPKPTPTPSPTPSPVELYTSPPLPVPIASHDPADSPTP